jgi:NADPH-dependent curcumin reductase CurA
MSGARTSVGPLANRCYRLRRRPQGSVTEADLEFVEEPLPAIEADQALIRTLLLSIDPSNRIGMSEVHYNLPPVAIGAVMRGFGIGEVVESQRDDMKVGDLVLGLTGWEDYAVADDERNEIPFTLLPTPPPAPLTALLGALGHTGVTAYLGVEDIGRPQPGETMVVSAAAGAVGSVAGQIGKARGARVVGTAGSDAKRRHVVDELGFDACVNYKRPDWRERLDEATPDGIDIDFENVGGDIMEHVTGRLNVGARIVLCGLMADYNSFGETAVESGRLSAERILISRALVQSFLVLDNAARFPEAIEYLGGLIGEGKLRHEETLIDGLERARDALNQMFEGANTGKLLVKVAEPSREVDLSAAAAA